MRITKLPPYHLLLALGALSSSSCCFGFGAISLTRKAAGSTAKLHATISSTSWKPFVQPRFDEFANCIVGPWVARDSLTEKHEVEEVMRSCGGAVQGIKELSLSVISPSQDANQEKIYLNRADGGFVYVDDGSYSFGPEKWDLTSEAVVMTSLAFTGSQRGWLTSKSSSEKEMLCQSTVLEMFRPISSVTENVRVDSIEKDDTIPTVHWERVKRVRMPNPSQPWVLARAKWEQQILQDEVGNDGDQLGTGSLMGWSFIETTDSNENELFGDILGSESSICVHMMAICQESAVARSTTRCYDSTGLLKGVAFLEGHVVRRGNLD